MTKLVDLGVTVQRSFISHQSSITIGGTHVSQTNDQLTKLTMTLPKPSVIRASFRKESWGDAVVKIFKKELQTGDAEFDKLVYITTETPSETAAFLQSPETRAAIALAIDTGGPIEIDGTTMIAHSIGHDQNDDPTVVKIVETLLA
ncbi:hypothetical protein BH09MYX1_BH09MYX1_55810 [soil metagenome]